MITQESDVSVFEIAKSDTVTPLVSVVMTVYNASQFLDEAIQSIRNQTYSRWELVCWDDGSSDGSWDTLQHFAQKDKRIRVFRDGKHRGVAGAANMGLSKVRGNLIARMDADDVASCDRLERQVKYLMKHPDIVAVGGQCVLIDSEGRVIGEKRFPTNPEKVRRMIFSTIPVQQPTLVVNRNRLPSDFQWYREETTVAIEVELLFKFFQFGNVTNINETVLKYRIHKGNISLRHPKKTFLVTLQARVRAVLDYGYRPSLGGLLITAVQAIMVTLMPSGWIYPIYALVQRTRGLANQTSTERRRTADQQEMASQGPSR